MEEARDARLDASTAATDPAMTSPLYLVAHKVRGQPAFDVATQLDCPECNGGTRDAVSSECSECDSLGYWWIIPTSGHRAYPWWHTAITQIGTWNWYIGQQPIDVPNMPDALPDHYTTRAAPTQSLADALGLTTRKAPSRPILRRF